MSKSLSMFFWISATLFTFLGAISLILSAFDGFRIVPLITLIFGLILIIFTYLNSINTNSKKFKKKFEFLSLLMFWIITLTIIIFSLEQYQRWKNGFNLIDLSLKTHLVPKFIYDQNNTRRIFNSDYVEENNLNISNPNENIFNPINIFGVKTISPPYLLKRNKSYSYEKGKFKEQEKKEKIHFKTNSNGFRGPEINFQKKFTILCLGASTTEGSNSNENNTYPQHLQRLINYEYQDIQIINMGHSGYTPEDIYNLFKFNLNLKPDIIIYFEGNGNGLDRKEVYSDESISISTLINAIYKRLMIGRIIFNSVPNAMKNIYLNNQVETFDLYKDRPSKKEYFIELEKIIELSLNESIVPILVTPTNGWHKDIQFTDEEFINMNKEINDYWPLTPKEIELFYIDYAQKYKDLAYQKGVKLINIENDFKDDKSLFFNAENKLTDLHHFSPKGNKKLAELIYKELNLIIKELK
tara:strand:- start:2705 stop:4111 length:1407 start_codon:yes stop_codon:yes gene_type:complete